MTPTYIYGHIPFVTSHAPSMQLTKIDHLFLPSGLANGLSQLPSRGFLDEMKKKKKKKKSAKYICTYIYMGNDLSGNLAFGTPTYIHQDDR